MTYADCANWPPIPKHSGKAFFRSASKPPAILLVNLDFKTVLFLHLVLILQIILACKTIWSPIITPSCAFHANWYFVFSIPLALSWTSYTLLQPAGTFRQSGVTMCIQSTTILVGTRSHTIAMRRNSWLLKQEHHQMHQWQFRMSCS